MLRRVIPCARVGHEGDPRHMLSAVEEGQRKKASMGAGDAYATRRLKMIQGREHDNTGSLLAIDYMQRK